jgi:hypothetical protein
MATRVRDVVDEDFVALVDRAASEAAYRLGGAYRALRGVRPSVGHRLDPVIVAGVAGFVGVMAVLTARRWMAKVGEMIRALEVADSVRLRAAEKNADGAGDVEDEPNPDDSRVGVPTPPGTEPTGPVVFDEHVDTRVTGPGFSSAALPQ